jgi:hypothetical protein
MMLDVFKGDAFSFTKLVEAINRIPYAPTRIGRMGLFDTEGVSTTTVAVEMQNGVLTLVPTGPRGSRGPAKNLEKRTVRNFSTVHLPQTVNVLADEVQGIRVFGSESETETAQAYLMKKMAIARRDLDLTHEFQRIGALKGIVLDADGTTEIYDYFTEFGLTQQTLSFELDVDATKVRGLCQTVERMVEDKLGGLMMVGGLHAFVGKTFFDALVDHPAVQDTFKNSGSNSELRKNQRMAFEFGGIVFEEYRGSVGGTAFIGDSEGFVFPLGVPGMFQTYFAPADYMETVNTIGLPFYAKPKMMDFDKGIEYDVQSNPLHMNTRPEAVIKLTLT